MAVTRQDIQKRILTLRAENRLGMHSLEGFALGALTTNPSVISDLRETDITAACDLLKTYGDGRLKMFSTTLLPNGSNVIPWGVYGEAGLSMPQYLIDLSQTSPSYAARIVVVSDADIGSGFLPARKDIQVAATVTDLTNMNVGDGRPPAEQAADERNGLMRGAAMLDRLAEYYEEVNQKLQEAQSKNDSRRHPHNEVLAVISDRHVLGLTVSLYNQGINPLVAEAEAVLMGVSMFFEHQEYGMERPLFAYDIHAAPEQSLSLLAENEEQARAMAAKASEQLKQVSGAGEFAKNEGALRIPRILKSLLEERGVEVFAPDERHINRSLKAPPEKEIIRGIVGQENTQQGPWSASASKPLTSKPGLGQ